MLCYSCIQFNTFCILDPVQKVVLSVSNLAKSVGECQIYACIITHSVIDTCIIDLDLSMAHAALWERHNVNVFSSYMHVWQ